MKKNGYKRSTPVGRVLKNVTKTLVANARVYSRLMSWEHSDEKEVASAIMDARLINVTGTSILEHLRRLTDRDWAPPKKSLAIVLEMHDQVTVADKYRAKYEAVYKPEVLSSLVVSKILESGELVVRSGQTQFIVSKSHLVRRRVSVEVIKEISSET